MNVLKPHKRTTIFTLLGLGKSQRDIERITGIDRKTIRSYQRLYETQRANSPGVATNPSDQIPPPWPPAGDAGVPPVRDPNRKGTVESAIGHTQATALKGRRFETLASNRIPSKSGARRAKARNSREARTNQVRAHPLQAAPRAVCSGAHASGQGTANTQLFGLAR